MVNARLVLASTLVMGASLAHADRIKVAIVPGIAVNLDAARVDALSQDLAEALQTELDIDAVGGLEVRRMLPPDGLPPDCVTTPACRADVAKRVGASQLLFVVMVNSGAGGSVQVDPTFFELSTGKTASRPAVDLTSTVDADAKAKFQTVATQLLPDAPVRPKPKTGGGLSGEVKQGVPRHFTRPALIAGGAGVAGLGVGITFGLLARSKFSSCDRDVQNCPANDSRRSQARTYSHIADVGWGVAAIGAVVAISLYATSGEQPSVILAPAAEPGGVSLSAIGSF